MTDRRRTRHLHVTLLEPKKPVLMPHETNCGWYYIVRPENNGERVLNSCPMPQLFDMVTFECRNYTEVKCKDRFEPKDACKCPAERLSLLNDATDDVASRR